MENREKYIWVSNHQIHEEAKLPLPGFLDTISCVETLRTQPSLCFTLYPTSKNEYEMNLKLWDYLNKSRNSLNSGYKVFNVEFPKPLYYFLKHTNRVDVFKPIVLGLAGHYVFNPEKRKILQEQVYEPVFEKMLSIVNKYFKDFVDVIAFLRDSLN